MLEHFAVIDVGSNALRFQLASVPQPKRYRVLEQDRLPVRLGYQVFQTGQLDSRAAEQALTALAKFKATADRYRVKALRAVGTSALREASDAKAFTDRVRKLGVHLEVISEAEEARLISLGIMSGLQFHLPLGLFVDIGGGSVEMAVANASSNYCLFSLPLGAVRITERFLQEDPPRRKGIKHLRYHVEETLQDVVKRIRKEKFTMAFGSGGTLTTLAETDARLAGDSKIGSLAVLRRPRLKTLIEILMQQPAAERARLISGDPKRADIIVAGALVLHEIMVQAELDYLFVSKRGLRDGVMVDLLRKKYGESAPWQQESERAQSVEQVFQKYDGGAVHSAHVSQLALSLFYQLQPLHKLGEKDAGILHAAAMLHDIGHFITQKKHHKHSYYLIKSSGLESFNKLELELVANIARYHRKAHPSPKHLGFSQLSPDNQDVVRKLSAVLRVADALDFKRAQAVKSVACAYHGGKVIDIACSAAENVSDEIHWALQKGKLIEEVFDVKLSLNRAKPRSL
ncbi:MAG: Ppx/GppA family phosphatase [Deltaproteobacteria bacterium]|nr:Ppx/GppA family phosphatase [Deltaproteobacteria bacterium]